MFPYYYNLPFGEIIRKNSEFIDLRKNKFNPKNIFNIKIEDIGPIIKNIEKITKNDKVIISNETPFIYVNCNYLSNTFFRPFVSKIFYGYSHYDLIDFLIEFIIFCKINFIRTKNEIGNKIMELSEFYPKEKEIFIKIHNKLI